MGKDEQGLLDWLVGDIANSIEIMGAVEASRDENGKVDQWKAAGIAMGLGHTSDDELAILAAYLGAEGAFDDEYCGDLDITGDFFHAPAPVSASAVKEEKSVYLTEEDYEKQKKSIISKNNLLTGALALGLCFVTIINLSAMRLYPEGTVLYFLMLIFFGGSLIYTISHVSKSRECELSALEERYNESKHKQEDGQRSE